MIETYPFTVDFNVNEASSKYICLRYNLETSEIVCPYAIPVVSNNGLTMTCKSNGATQLFLDSSGLFLGTGDCLIPPTPTPTPTPSPTPVPCSIPTPSPTPTPTPSPSSTPVEKSDGSSEISTGGIIGIVIGSVAGSIMFSVGGFLLYKKLIKIRIVNYDAK